MLFVAGLDVPESLVALVEDWSDPSILYVRSVDDGRRFALFHNAPGSNEARDADGLSAGDIIELHPVTVCRK